MSRQLLANGGREVPAAFRTDLPVVVIANQDIQVDTAAQDPFVIAQSRDLIAYKEKASAAEPGTIGQPMHAAMSP